MTVSDHDTKMDVDTVTSTDALGPRSHLADAPSTLKDSPQPMQPPSSFISTDAKVPSHSTSTPGTATAELIAEDEQPQQTQTKPGDKDADSKTTPNVTPENVTVACPEVDDEGDDDLYRNKYPSAVFRPQLDDIVMDQDLLDFYEQLKFLVSLSPLKTAQVLYAFSLATEHLSPELEVRRSVLDMNRRAFSFYQENTWFTVDLESNEDLSDDEAYESSDPKFRILPARHGLFPALQKQPFGYQSDPRYYNPYPPHPNYHAYPYPPYGELGHYPPYGSYDSEPRPSSPARQDAEVEEEREGRPRDRERPSRSHRRATKSSKRRRSRDSESSVRPSGSVTKIRLRTSGYNEQSTKKSKRDPDSPSLSSMDGVRKHHRRSTETGDTAMELSHRKDPDRHRVKEHDADYNRERMERRLARKLKKAKRSGEHGDRHKDGGSVQSKVRPLKITLVQSGKTSGAHESTGDDASKASQSWNGNADQNADGGNSAYSHRNIQPQNGSTSASADDTNRSANTNTHAPQPIPRKPKHSLQASPIQTTPTNGGQTAPGPLSSDKSDDKLKKGTWTAAEEEILLEAVRGLSSENWHAVAQMVPGRNAKQCMQKWQTDLDPQINRLPWTEAEDEKLVEAYHKYGNSWQQIAKMVETRTWYQCYNRVRAKSVKTKIQQTTGTHPASIANGGIPGGPRPEGSKPGAKRDGDRRKGHPQGGMQSGLASGPSMEPRSQAGPSQPRPTPSNGEASSSGSGGDYIRMKGQQMQGVLVMGPSSQASGSNSGPRDQSTSSSSQGLPTNTEGATSGNSGSDYHRASSTTGRQQDASQNQVIKPTPPTPSSQSQFHPQHSPQQPPHHQQHSQRPPAHQSSPHTSQHQVSPLKSVKSEPQQQPTTPQPKQEPGYWPKQPTTSSSPRPASPKGYRTPQHSQAQQSSPHRQHSHAISPAPSHSPSQSSQHHHQQGMQPPPPPSSHSNYPSQSPGPKTSHMSFEGQSGSNSGSSNGSGSGSSGGTGLGIHQGYSSQPSSSQQHSGPYHSSPHPPQHHRQQPSSHPQQSPQQQSPHYRQKSSNSGHLRPVPPLSATLAKGQSPSSAGLASSSSPSISMQPQHGHRPPMPSKSHSGYSPSTLPPIQQQQSQPQSQQQSPKPFSSSGGGGGGQRLPSFNGPPASSSTSSSSSASSPHPLLPPVQPHLQNRHQGPPPSSPPPSQPQPQALGPNSSSSSSPSPYTSGPPPSIVTSSRMTPPGNASSGHSSSSYSTPILAPPLLSPTIANSPTGGFISTSALLMMARQNAQQAQQQAQQHKSPGGGSGSGVPSASIPPP